jgi:hypothetical protein
MLGTALQGTLDTIRIGWFGQAPTSIQQYHGGWHAFIDSRFEVWVLT